MLGTEPLEISTSTLLDCKKISFLNVKMHLILNRIPYLLYDITHKQKVGGGLCRVTAPLSGA